MKHCFITFRSITYAQRGQEVLRRAGLSPALSRTPRALAEKGCGYSLRLPREKADFAKALLRGSKVSYSRVYCATPTGEMEELP